MINFSKIFIQNQFYIFCLLLYVKYKNIDSFQSEEFFTRKILLFIIHGQTLNEFLNFQIRHFFFLCKKKDLEITLYI